MNNIIFSLLVVGLGALAGCTTNLPVPKNTYSPGDYDAMDYYSWVTLASEEEILQEVGRLEASANEMGSEESLVQLAVLISAMPTDPLYELLALDLLALFEERVASSAVESDYLAFAGLWRQFLELRQESHLVDERIRAGDEHIRAGDEHIRAVDERIVALEREREALRAQIEALTSIEQQLDRREQVRGNFGDELVQ